MKRPIRNGVAIMALTMVGVGCGDLSDEDLLTEPAGGELTGTLEQPVVNGWTNWANITCADGECTAWSALCSSGSLIDGVHREPNRIRAHCRAAAGSTTGAVWKNDGASCPAGQLGTGLRCDTKYCDHPKTRCSVPVGLSVDPTSTNVTVADFSSIIFPASHYLRRTNCGTTQCEWTYSRAQLVPTP